jgi:hypothetical protein
MRNGEHNGIVRVEEQGWVSADAVLEAVEITFSEFESLELQVKYKFPKCFLYNIALQSYVRIPYPTLTHHLRLVDLEARFDVRVERNIHTNRPTTIYVR